MQESFGSLSESGNSELRVGFPGSTCTSLPVGQVGNSGADPSGLSGAAVFKLSQSFAPHSEQR